MKSKQKKIPLPKSGAGRPKGTFGKSMWDTLQVGDTKFFPVYAKGISARIGLLNYIKVRGLSWKVSARKEKEGLRIWRIK